MTKHVVIFSYNVLQMTVSLKFTSIDPGGAAGEQQVKRSVPDVPPQQPHEYFISTMSSLKGLAGPEISVAGFLLGILM